MTPTKDWLGREAACELAGKIQLYWAERGRRVKVEVIEHHFGRHSFCSIRSDLTMRAPEMSS